MLEHKARDLEVRVRVSVQVQIFLLKFNNVNIQRHKLQRLFSLIIWFEQIGLTWFHSYNCVIFSCHSLHTKLGIEFKNINTISIKTTPHYKAVASTSSSSSSSSSVTNEWNKVRNSSVPTLSTYQKIYCLELFLKFNANSMDKVCAVFIILVICQEINNVESRLLDSHLQNTFLSSLTGQRTINGFLFYHAERVIKETQITRGVRSYQLGNSALLWLQTRLGRVTISHASYFVLFRTWYTPIFVSPQDCCKKNYQQTTGFSIEHKEEIHIFHKSLDLLLSIILNINNNENNK